MLQIHLTACSKLWKYFKIFEAPKFWWVLNGCKTISGALRVRKSFNAFLNNLTLFQMYPIFKNRLMCVQHSNISRMSNTLDKVYRWFVDFWKYFASIKIFYCKEYFVTSLPILYAFITKKLGASDMHMQCVGCIRAKIPLKIQSYDIGALNVGYTYLRHALIWNRYNFNLSACII